MNKTKWIKQNEFKEKWLKFSKSSFFLPNPNIWCRGSEKDRHFFFFDIKHNLLDSVQMRNVKNQPAQICSWCWCVLSSRRKILKSKKPLSPVNVSFSKRKVKRFRHMVYHSGGITVKWERSCRRDASPCPAPRAQAEGSTPERIISWWDNSES